MLKGIVTRTVWNGLMRFSLGKGYFDIVETNLLCEELHYNLKESSTYDISIFDTQIGI